MPDGYDEEPHKRPEPTRDPDGVMRYELKGKLLPSFKEQRNYLRAVRRARGEDPDGPKNLPPKKPDNGWDGSSQRDVAGFIRYS